MANQNRSFITSKLNKLMAYNLITGDSAWQFCEILTNKTVFDRFTKLNTFGNK